MMNGMSLADALEVSHNITPITPASINPSMAAVITSARCRPLL